MKRRFIISLVLFSLLALSNTAFAQNDRAGFERMMQRKIFDKERVGSKEGLELPLAERAGPENNITSTGSLKEGEVHAAINPTDSSNIVIACMSHDAQGNARISSYYSETFGTGWRKSILFDLPSSQAVVYGGGDPVITFDPNGKAYLCWIYYYKKSSTSSRAYWEVLWAESLDKGKTWVRQGNNKDRAVSAEVDFNSLKIYSGIIPDKPWIACTPQGDLIMTCTGWDMQYKTNVFQFVKKYGTSSFQTRVTTVTNSGVNERNHSTLAINSAGTIYSVFANYKSRASRGGLTYYVASKGKNASRFSAPIAISEAQIPGLSSGQTSPISKAYLNSLNLSRLYGNQQLAIDNSQSIYKDNLYLVWNANGINSKLNNGLDIYFSSSSDGGANWTTAKIINQDVKGIDVTQHHPTIFVNEKGYVFVAWYDRRNSHSNKTSDFYLAISKNGGQSFSEVKLTTQATNFDQQLKGTFHIGEYVQVLASADVAMPIWIDGRNQNNDFDVFVATVDVNNPVGISKLNSVNNTLLVSRISPNPGSGIFSLTLEAKKNLEGRIFLTDLSGKRVKEIANTYSLYTGSSRLTINISELNAGIYLLHIVTAEGKLIERIVKN